MKKTWVLPSPSTLVFIEHVESTSLDRMLIRVPLFERDWRVPLKKELGVEWRLDSTHETEYTIESWAQEIEKVGLTVTRQEVRWSEIWEDVIKVDS